MRVMYLVKSNHPGPPSPELGAAIGKLTEREVKAARLLDQGGLMPISMGAEVRVSDGKLSLIDGPFVDANEVVGGFALFELRDKEESIAMANEFMQLHKDLIPGWYGTCEVRIFATPPHNPTKHP